MRRHMFRWSPARIIAGAFGSISFIGSILLYLPWGHMPGQSITYVDALYTAVSALCVTGLSIVDTAAVFNPFGQVILAVLIQVGGLGVSTMGAGVLLMLGRKVGIRQRNLIHDTMNLDSYSGVVRFLRTLFATTVFIEIIGAFLGYFVFRRDYEMMESIGLSIFHSISSFNNAGLTILTKERSMEMYAEWYLSINRSCRFFFLLYIKTTAIQSSGSISIYSPASPTHSVNALKPSLLPARKSRSPSWNT